MLTCICARAAASRWRPRSRWSGPPDGTAHGQLHSASCAHRPARPGDPRLALRIQGVARVHRNRRFVRRTRAHPSAPAPAARPAAEELIQLLTPEGERIRRPTFPLDVSAATVRGLFRDIVPFRRLDGRGHRAAAPGRARASGRRCSARRRPRSAPAARSPQDWLPHLPRARRGLVRGVTRSSCSGCSAASATAAGTRPSKFPPVHDRDRHPDAARHRVRHGHPARRGRGDPTATAVIAYFGDGATSQGDVNEAFIWAAVNNAPVVFFCQNNQWAISEPIERQSRIPLYQRARGFGFPGVRVDGNDVLACLAVPEALDGRAGGPGPAFIEAFTYRMGAHTTSDDPTRYRIAAELETWKLQRPDRAGRRHTCPAPGWPTTLLRRGGGRGGRAGAACARPAGPCRTRRRWPCSTTSTPSRTATLDEDATRTLRRVPRTSLRRGQRTEVAQASGGGH